MITAFLFKVKVPLLKKDFIVPNHNCKSHTCILVRAAMLSFFYMEGLHGGAVFCTVTLPGFEFSCLVSLVFQLSLTVQKPDFKAKGLLPLGVNVCGHGLYVFVRLAED